MSRIDLVLSTKTLSGKGAHALNVGSPAEPKTPGGGGSEALRVGWLGLALLTKGSEKPDRPARVTGSSRPNVGLTPPCTKHLCVALRNQALIEIFHPQFTLRAPAHHAHFYDILHHAPAHVWGWNPSAIIVVHIYSV